MLPRPLLLALLAVAALLCAGAPAGARIALPATPPPVAGNPADRLVRAPIEPFGYDAARRCTPRASRRGTAAFIAWLERHARGVSWGSYRCERWGRGSASLHAENRAVDWHLDARRRADRAEARRLVLLLLAPDAAGNPQALARRMGVQEVIWDCGYWAMGMTRFSPYRACHEADGSPREDVDPTTAHRDHVHFGLTRRGAAGRTSFWAAA